MPKASHWCLLAQIVAWMLFALGVLVMLLAALLLAQFWRVSGTSEDAATAFYGAFGFSALAIGVAVTMVGGSAMFVARRWANRERGNSSADHN